MLGKHISRKPLKDCCVCGKKVFSNWSMYCHNCHKTIRRMHRKKFPKKAQQGVLDYIRKTGYRCRYSGIFLELDDDTGPWYLAFDHWMPGDPNIIAIAAALINEMKQDLTEDEFWYYVFQLDDHRKKHTKFKKRRPHFWYRLSHPSKTHRHCPVCGHRVFSRWNKYCPRCSKVAKRMIAEHFDQKTIQAVWDYVRKYGYVCYYTGMPLDLDNEHSPWYLSFDHWIPNDPRKIVITSRMINSMKQDLTEEEFWYIISQLTNHRRYGTPVRKIKLKYWSRPYGR